MKTLILIILFFFLASVTQAVNTTCYVASDGAAGNTGLTPDSPKALPSQCLTVLAGAAPTTGHTLYIEKGSYTDNMTVSNANLAGVSIIGVDDLLTLAAANRSDVVISKTDDRVLYATRNCSISNLSMTGGTTALSLAKTDAAGITVTATNVHLYDARKYIVYVNAGSSWVSTGSKYEGGNDTDGWQCGILLNSNGPNSWTGSFDVYGPGALYSFGTNWGFANLGTGTLSLSNVDVAQVVREASDIASHGISKSEITINSCASDGLVIKTDAELLARALHEILVNAMAAGDGPIEIAIAREVSDAVILVTDSGTGIPDEVLPRVFEPFFTTKEKARGLGLTRTLAFIEQLGGTVEIAKNGPDGTTVSVRVPDRGQNK